MKNIFILATLFLSMIIQAQTHELIKHDGQKIDVNFIKVANDQVFYNSKENQEEKSVSQFAVAQLIEKSNSDVKMISNKITLSSKEDYNKVILLEPNQTEGLKEIGFTSSFLGKTKGETNQDFKDKAIKRLKQHAAAKGYPFIVMVSYDSKNIKAKMYSY
ncbi:MULTISPECIES: hypothetical protein [unclassified Flavobacterium]|uniref:hypothetical protein n=1 Tax=unclassified Flavobacterium TaxID=196869 RepID=UPI00131AA3B0|nr:MULTISPECIES: hypothetical protein [unclassified Flavobacterium]